MIYVKSGLVGLLSIVAGFSLYIGWILYITREARAESDGLVGIAGGGREMLVIAIVFFAVGSGLMYLHLR